MVFGTPVTEAFGIDLTPLLAQPGGETAIARALADSLGLPEPPTAEQVTEILSDYQRLQAKDAERRANKAASQRRFRSNYTKTKA